MSDDNMIPSDVWDELDAWDKSQESDRRREYELKSRIESGDVEEPGIGDYDAYPQSDDADAELSAMRGSESGAGSQAGPALHRMPLSFTPASPR